MAVYLLASVNQPDQLSQLSGQQRSLSGQERSALDECLTKAVRALRLPSCWNMMGNLDRSGKPSECLLHLCARLGLSQLCHHLLTLPGSQAALSAQDASLRRPEDVARECGHHDLASLLQFYRKRDADPLPFQVAIEKEQKNLLVISSDVEKPLENDILELEKRKISLSDSEFTDCDSENMKELNDTRNGNRLKNVKSLLNSNRSASLPRRAVRSSSPGGYVRVLENNLRRIRDIHEGIQKLRDLNTKQIVVHSSKKKSVRLSSSCPALYMTSGDEYCVSLDGAAMRTIQQGKTSFSPNSRSLDSPFIEPFSVKIHVNDLTPAASQECLNLISLLTESENRLQSDSKSICRTSNIGGTTSKRLAKRANKKVPTRRQSWSSIGATLSSPDYEDKQLIQRRWSLSSLDSDAEETYSKSSNSSASFYSRNLRSSKPTSFSLTSRTLSDGSYEANSVLSKSAKQSSSSVPTINATSADIKENVEPKKTHSVGSLGSSAKNFLISFRNHPLQKSLSTPTITVEDALAEKAKEEIGNRPSLSTMHPLPLHDLSSQLHESLDCDDTNADGHQLSLTSLIRDFHMNSAAVDSDEEKVFVKRKKRSSIFFKKKPDKQKSKEAKKVAHQYVVYNGSLANCDACQKQFNRKPALKCENCLVVVHDSGCKDQVMDCNKFKLQRSASRSGCGTGKDSSTVNENSSHQGKYSLPSNKFNFPLPHANIPPLGEAASRSSFININKMLSEDSTDASYELQSNITDINSASMESLDEGAAEISDFEDNSMLRLIDDEPETWNAAVDKKIIRKLKDREIKRQEAIHELIITEKHHCLTLQIMQKVYAQGMMKELNAPKELIDKLFPCLGDLVEIHCSLLYKLRERQSEGPVIENITDILADQFHDQKAEQMKHAYGQFCSQHIESLNLYKEMLKSDRKFQNFIKKCKSKRLCKTKGIPECLLLVTQRITKYILMIESLIKSAKDNKEEQETLEKIQFHLKDIISSVDFQVAEKEREMRLLEIFNRMDAKSTIMYHGKKFKKSDLLACNRKLKKEGPMTWRSPRGKTIDVLAVMLSDVILFLQENNQKLCFASLENKPGIVSLQKLLVRKKAGQDSRGMYLISSNPTEPEMIELFCRTSKDQKAWMETIREAIEICPDEDEGVPSETEEERKLEAARDARIKQLTCLLHEKDLSVAHLCEDRMRILIDLLEMCGIETEQFENVRYTHLVEGTSGTESKELISSAINSASRLASNLYTSGTNLSRSVSSAGERQSDTYVSPLLPKRAETFGGFDNPTKEQVPVVKVPAFKRKLLHFKEHTELPSKTKADSNMGESLETALHNFGLQTSLSVMGKTPSLFGSPEKQQNPKLLSPNYQQYASFLPLKETSAELMNLSITPLLMSQGKEQLMQIVELAHNLNTIICTVSHLSSTVESMKVHIATTDDKLTKLTKEKEARDKRPMYRPEHQLEELRNLQKQLNHDRAVWQQEKMQNESELKSQREELEKLQEQIKVEQTDVTHQRELLYRKLDALQKQGIILSPSHNVVNLNSCIPRDLDPKDDSTLFSDSCHPSAPDFSHRRTVSYDLGHSNEEQIPYVSSGTCSAAPSHRIDSKNRPSLNLSQSNSSKIPPLHLSNIAASVQKRQTVAVQAVKQQLPLKLAAANTHTGNGSGPLSQSPVMNHAGPQQVLPMKLAIGSLSQGMQSSKHTETKSAAPKRSHSAASSPSSTLTTPVHVRGGSSPALVQSTSPTSTGLSPKFKVEGSILQHLKFASEKSGNKKDDGSKEIFC